MLSSCPGQVDFATGQVTFHSHSANGRGLGQVVLQVNNTCSFNHGSPLFSICNSLEVITFTAFSVGELGNKSMKAWPSPKDCIRLGSSGIETTKKEKKYSIKI